MARAEGEIEPKFFMVYYEEATNWGFDKVDIKYFRDLGSARKYAEGMVKDLEKVAKESDDYEGVLIENEKGETVELWRAEGGKVVHH